MPLARRTRPHLARRRPHGRYHHANRLQAIPQQGSASRGSRQTYLAISFVEEIIASPRIEDAYRRYLRFAEEHPAEYTLFSAVWSQLFVLEEQRPGEIWLRSQLANQFGGKPEEYVRTYYALLLLCHGAAGLINQMADERTRTEVRENCIAVCDAIVQHANLFRAPA